MTIVIGNVLKTLHFLLKDKPNNIAIQNTIAIWYYYLYLVIYHNFGYDPKGIIDMLERWGKGDKKALDFWNEKYKNTPEYQLGSSETYPYPSNAVNEFARKQWTKYWRDVKFVSVYPNTGNSPITTDNGTITTVKLGTGQQVKFWEFEQPLTDKNGAVFDGAVEDYIMVNETPKPKQEAFLPAEESDLEVVSDDFDSTMDDGSTNFADELASNVMIPDTITGNVTGFEGEEELTADELSFFQKFWDWIVGMWSELFTFFESLFVNSIDEGIRDHA